MKCDGSLRSALRSRLRVTERDAFARVVGHRLQETHAAIPGRRRFTQRDPSTRSRIANPPRDAHHAPSLWSSTCRPLLSLFPAMLSGRSVVQCLTLLAFVEAGVALTPVDPSKSPRILRPNGADVWTVGDVATIRWCVAMQCIHHMSRPDWILANGIQEQRRPGHHY